MNFRIMFFSFGTVEYRYADTITRAFEIYREMRRDGVSPTLFRRNAAGAWTLYQH